MGYDCNSKYTKGRCHKCNVAWYWTKGRWKLKDTRCPQCGGELRTTTHYFASCPWRPLPAEITTERKARMKALKLRLKEAK